MAGLIERISFSLTEDLESLLLCSKGIREEFSGTADCLGDGGSLSFEELDQMELVVGVVDEVDLLEFSGLGGIESSLFLSKGVVESSSLGIERLNECVVVVVERIVEGSCISGETVVEGSPLAAETGSKGSSGITKGLILRGLHVSNDSLHSGEVFFNTSLESSLLSIDQLVDLVLGVWVSVLELSLEILDGVHNVLTKIIDL